MSVRIGSAATERAGLLLLLGLSWGLNWPLIRIALDELPPWTFRAAGFAGGTAIVFGILWATGTSPVVPRRHWGRLALIGILTVVAYNLLSAFAQLTVTTSRSVVLSYTMPIWAVLLSRLVLGEPIDGRRMLGLALGVAGLATLGWPMVRDGQLSWGVLYAVASGICWAGGSVVLKRWPIDASPFVITAWQIALGAVVTLVGALLIDGVPARLPQRPGTWIGLAYNALVGQALATTLWFTILRRMPAGIASIGSLLVPAIAVLGATLLLGEHPTPADWLGLALILAASFVVLLPSGDPPLAPSTDR